MKHDRSNIYTIGLCDIVDNDRNKRVCFFEIDSFNALELFEVMGQYYSFGLDVLIHRTGKGFHFLSPTLVALKEWKDFHEPLKHINSECPMTCLRIEPNKWKGEDILWKNSIRFNFKRSEAKANISEYCDLFKIHFGITFRPDICGDIKTVSYPLPTQITCINCSESFDKIQEKNHICATK